MSWFKDLPLSAFLLMTAFSFQAGAVTTVSRVATPTSATTSSFKSYREWKTDQVLEAQNKISTIKFQLDQRRQARQVAQGTDPNLARQAIGAQTQAGQDVVAERMQRQLRQELYDLEIAKDLSVTDYFVGYLTKIQDKKTAINEVAEKLTAEEVAELMTAYANSVFGSETADLPVSASNMPKDQLK